ncbi:unnamed protein product [Cercospora beticola]|nr:unnamed protein product [Cercospora beticola]
MLLALCHLGSAQGTVCHAPKHRIVRCESKKGAEWPGCTVDGACAAECPGRHFHKTDCEAKYSSEKSCVEDPMTGEEICDGPGWKPYNCYCS